MELTIKVAQRRSEILQCQYMIASIYHRYYDIVFSTDIVDLNAKIEPYPHQYIMGLLDGQLAACAGLYIGETYITRYGDVDDNDIIRLLEDAGVRDRYREFELHELTKLVVAEKWEGQGIARFFLAACHNASFLRGDAQCPWLLSTCAKLSIFRNFHQRIGINTRIIKPFPIYPVHEHYSSARDPMDSRLIIPELDIPRRWLELTVPGTYEVEEVGARK